MGDPQLSDPQHEGDMHRYYERGLERDRLSSGQGRLEFERTLELVLRTLPSPPAVVADIGGGPGRYTSWLTDQGYDVVHRDPVPLHVQQVLDDLPDVDSAVGDARQLDLGDESVDVVLLLGPLYHLPIAADRQRALDEAHRIVRRDGVVFVAAISRWAPRLDGLLLNRVHVGMPRLLELIDEVEATGELPAPIEGGFCGYTHRPHELRAEIEAAGLSVEGLASVEGMACALPDIDARLDNPAERSLLFDALAATESVPELVGIGPHILATARRS